MKTVVLYIFHEFNERVAHFINHALFDAPDVDFVIMCNDLTFDIASMVPSYVKTYRRENIGFDFGAWSDLLLTHGYQHGYDHYVFVNSSVIGPFMDGYPGKRWTDVFVEGLTDDTRLFGVTINCNAFYFDPEHQSHVQSYLYAMNRDTVSLLINEGLFSLDYVATFVEAIFKKEVMMSRIILNQGWNIGCIHTYYKGVDWRFRDKKPSEYPFPFLPNDVMYPQYKDIVWSLSELVFIKGNR